MNKRKTLFTILLALALFALSSCQKKQKSNSQIIASTSWTAAIAYIAGADQVDIVAPANLIHPPEYEVTVEDIKKISECKYFVYAGFESMMKTLGDKCGSAQMIQIACNNSIKTVSEESKKLSDFFGTQEKQKARIEEYTNTILKGKARLEKAGLSKAKVLCNANQIFLAKDLGLKVAATFGPGPVTAEDLKNASEISYAFIIDNIHNPQGAPLAEVSLNSKYIIWRNFPDSLEKDALQNLVQDNIELLF